MTESHNPMGFDEHSPTGFCKGCWNRAYLRMLDQPSKSQSEHYKDILKEFEQ